MKLSHLWYKLLIFIASLCLHCHLRKWCKFQNQVRVVYQITYTYRYWCLAKCGVHFWMLCCFITKITILTPLEGENSIVKEWNSLGFSSMFTFILLIQIYNTYKYYTFENVRPILYFDNTPKIKFSTNTIPLISMNL